MLTFMLPHVVNLSAHEEICDLIFFIYTYLFIYWEAGGMTCAYGDNIK